MIDKITANLYTCCKCEYQWTSWDGHNKKESPIPNSCPKCKNVRWNQHYTKERDSTYQQDCKDAYDSKGCLSKGCCSIIVTVGLLNMI